MCEWHFKKSCKWQFLCFIVSGFEKLILIDGLILLNSNYYFRFSVKVHSFNCKIFHWIFQYLVFEKERGKKNFNFCCSLLGFFPFSFLKTFWLYCMLKLHRPLALPSTAPVLLSTCCISASFEKHFLLLSAQTGNSTFDGRFCWAMWLSCSESWYGIRFTISSVPLHCSFVEKCCKCGVVVALVHYLLKKLLWRNYVRLVTQSLVRVPWKVIAPPPASTSAATIRNFLPFTNFTIMCIGSLASLSTSLPPPKYDWHESRIKGWQPVFNTSDWLLLLLGSPHL